jgi:hypothetical protein
VSLAFVASPVVAKVYFPTEDGDVYVVKAGATYELIAMNGIGEALLASLALVDARRR